MVAERPPRAPVIAKSAAETEVKMDWKAQKKNRPASVKRQNDLKKVGDEIHTRKPGTVKLMSFFREEIYTDVARLVELNNEKSPSKTGRTL